MSRHNTPPSVRGFVSVRSPWPVPVWAAVLALGLLGTPLWAQDLPREIDWKGAPPSFLYFRYQLLPLLRQQCGNSSCHGGFIGGRLHLAPPLETGEYSNQAALANYRSALALVNPEKRDTSLLLLKPLRADSLDFSPDLAGQKPLPHLGAPKQVSHKAPPTSGERQLFDAIRDWVKGRRVTNFAPVAYAGRNRVVSVGGKVILDAGLSFDPNPEDQRKLKYQWTLLSFPPGSKAKLKADTKPRPSFTADKGGTYIIRLEVRDPKRRDSEPSYVIVSAQGESGKADLTALDLRTTEKHEVPFATAKLSGAAKLVPAPDEAGKRGVLVAEKPDKSKADGELSFDVEIKRPGKYGLWLLVRDRVKEAETPRGPVTVSLDGRQQAALPVPADNENWRLIRYGSTQAVRASTDEDADEPGAMGAEVAAAGPVNKISGSWEDDPENKRLLATGVNVITGRNVAEVGVDAGGLMSVSATLHVTDSARIRNGYIVFDFRDKTNYKIAGVEIGTQPGQQRFVIDWVGGPKGVNFLKYIDADLEPNKDYSLKLDLTDDTAVLNFNGHKMVSQKFPSAFTGKIGVASLGSKTAFDDLIVWRNETKVYANGFGDDAKEPEAPPAAGGDNDPTKRLRRKKLLAFRLTEGRHKFTLGLVPGTPEIERAIVARIDTVADVPMAARKLTRAVYIDVLGRPPTEEELARDAGKAVPQLARELVATYEFWDWFYEQELFALNLIDTYRPNGIDEVDGKEIDYSTSASDLHNRKLTIADLYRRLVIGVFYHAKFYHPEDYTRALWEDLLGRDILDDPAAFEAAKLMYTEGKTGDEDEAPPPMVKGRPAVKKKAAPSEWSVLGRKGKTREDLVGIVLSQSGFAEQMVARLYTQYTGLKADPARVKKDAATLMAGWKSGQEALPELVVGWLSSGEYQTAVSGYRHKSDMVFVRGLFVDLFDRKPEFSEFWSAYRILRSLSDSEPLRVIVAGMMVESEEADVPLKSEVVRSEWIKEQIVKLLSRDAKASEVTALDKLLGQPNCRMAMLVRALVTHPEYQMY